VCNARLRDAIISFCTDQVPEQHTLFVANGFEKKWKNCCNALNESCELFAVFTGPVALARPKNLFEMLFSKGFAVSGAF
jgi:hypothetical protein